MMKLKEIKKHPSQMNKEELEAHMLSILDDMNTELFSINEEYRKDNGTSDRNQNTQVPRRYSPAV